MNLVIISLNSANIRVLMKPKTLLSYRIINVSLLKYVNNNKNRIIKKGKT